MLDINSDTVRFVIAKAHEFQTENGMQEGEDSPSPNTNLNPLEADRLEVSTNSGSYQLSDEFRTVIDDLEPDQQQSLVALMWLGRGDFSIEEWAEAVTEARAGWTLHTADYLLSTPLLADYLGEGLVLHGYELE